MDGRCANQQQVLFTKLVLYRCTRKYIGRGVHGCTFFIRDGSHRLCELSVPPRMTVVPRNSDVFAKQKLASKNWQGCQFLDIATRKPRLSLLLSGLLLFRIPTTQLFALLFQLPPCSYFDLLVKIWTRVFLLTQKTSLLHRTIALLGGYTHAIQQNTYTSRHILPVRFRRIPPRTAVVPNSSKFFDRKTYRWTVYIRVHCSTARSCSTSQAKCVNIQKRHGCRWFHAEARFALIANLLCFLSSRKAKLFSFFSAWPLPPLLTTVSPPLPYPAREAGAGSSLYSSPLFFIMRYINFAIFRAIAVIDIFFPFPCSVI